MSTEDQPQKKFNNYMGAVGYIIFDDGQYITSYIDMRQRSDNINDAHFYEKWDSSKAHSFTCDKVHRYLSKDAQIKRAIKTDEGVVIVDLVKAQA